MTTHYDLNIETLILVAIWQQPFIFQGSFTISNKVNDLKMTIVFRCLCHSENKMDIVDCEFSPDDYQFTHLLSDENHIDPTTIDHEKALALYLLKYALHNSLAALLMQPKPSTTYFDEIAMSAMTDAIKQQMQNQVQNLHETIGFSVAIDFTPREAIGQMAARALLLLNESKVHAQSLN